MSKSRDLLKNTFIIALGKLSTQLLNFFLIPLYTRYLSPRDYGQVDLILTYGYLLAPLLTIQLEMGAFRYLVDARSNTNEKINIISTTTKIVSSILAIFVVASLALGSFFHLNNALLITLHITAFTLTGLFLQYARGLGKIKIYTIASALTGLSTVLLTVLLVVLRGKGMQGILLTSVLSNTITSIFLFKYLNLMSYIKKASTSLSTRVDLIKYSLPLIPNAVSWWVISVSDRTIVTLILGLSANGIYALSNRFSAIYTSLFFIFSLSWTESASLHIISSDRDNFFSQVANSTAKFFGALCVVMISITPFIFKYIAGEQYREALRYIPILLVSAFLNSIVGIYSGVYIAQKMTKQVARASMSAAVINITLTLVLVPIIGIYGAATATLVAYLVIAIHRHFDINKTIPITYEPLLLVKIIAILTLVIALYYSNNQWANISGVILSFVSVYYIDKSIPKRIIVLIRKSLKNA
jgi:O-antigen/teichoic acid export membrane protein